MTLEELTEYHAAEAGLLDSDIVRELASDAGFDVNGLDLDQIAGDANGHAIDQTMRGDVLGARLFKTDSGCIFAEMGCGTITDGDIEWACESAFVAAMHDHGIAYTIERIA